MNTMIRLLIVALTCLILATPAHSLAVDFTHDVQPLLTKYCAGCHNPQDHEGELSLVDYAAMRGGGKHGAVIVPGESRNSRLWQVLLDGADVKMPPDGHAAPTSEEVRMIRDWIDAGAFTPADETAREALTAVPEFAASLAPKPVTALAVKQEWLAVGRYRGIDLLTTERQFIRRFEGLPGKVNAIEFFPNRSQLIAVGGTPGQVGLVWMCDLATGRVTTMPRSHDDALYAVAINAQGSRFATAGYDRKIQIWDAVSGQVSQTLTGHNGPVFDLAFAPDGRVLASASGDATVKVWDADSGQRLDTLSQPLQEQYTVAISPDGSFLAAGGADNRIRLWQLVSKTTPQINPLLVARYAHEQPVQRVRFAADGRQLVSSAADRTVKFWNANDLALLETQSLSGDMAQVLAVDANTQRVFLGRMDGGLESVSLATVKSSAKAENEWVTRTAVPRSSLLREPAISAESEPNNDILSARLLELPFRVDGKILGNDLKSGDRDLYRFTAKAGETWIFEVEAARKGSTLDSRLTILDHAGQSVPRVLLQAVRDSYFTFRGKDSLQTGDFRVHNWEEMQLNQFLYANGEVVKFYHYPRGPDSGFNVYPNFGNRHTYFETTPTTHALQEPCYIVEPHPPGAELAQNGLPVFTINFENDDESLRRWGSDSLLTFTAPTDGDYFVLVEDARGLSGDDFSYSLIARLPQPDFRAKLSTDKMTVALPGSPNFFSGLKFGVELERIDGFNGAVTFEFANVADELLVLTPLDIEAHQFRTSSAVYVKPGVNVEPGHAFGTIDVFAVATINGETVRHSVGQIGPVVAGEVAKIGIDLTGNTTDPGVLEIVAGEAATARIRIDRREVTSRVSFGNEDGLGNAPLGVYVANIGLNGVLITESESEREITIRCDPWVSSTERLVFVTSDVEGSPCSQPILLRVLPPVSVGE